MGDETTRKRMNTEMDPTSPEAAVSIHSMRMLMTELMEPMNDKLSNIEAMQADSIVRLAKVEKMKEHIDTIETSLSEKNHQISSLQAENTKLKGKVLSMESQQRRNNLQFLGVAESRNESCEDKIRQLCDRAQLNFNDRTFERVHRLGKYSDHRVRPIIARFHHFKDREEVFLNKSAFKRQSVIVVEDFPEDITARRRKLYPIVEAAYKYRDPLNPDFRYKARVIVDRLIINGTVYTVDTLDRLPNHLKPEIIATPSTNETVVFYSSASPLSNHYPCQFECKGTKYSSVEQYLMKEKAVLFHDNESSTRIMETSDPVVQKGIGRAVAGFNSAEWKREAQNVLMPGLRAKFSQVDECKAFLMATGNKLIGEASLDKFWGIGLKLGHDDIFNREKWESNVMGKALQEIRNELAASE